MKNNLEILTPQGFEKGDNPQKMSMKKRTVCERCGTCCRMNSPSLLKEDMGLFVSGILSYENTYTIRESERIRSRGDAEIYESFIELIKVKDKEGTSTCIFYDETDGCRIYENRPSQCRMYNCWTQENISEGLENKALKRVDIFGSIDIIMKAIKMHEEKSSYKRLSEALEMLSEGNEDVLDEIMDILQYDTYIRPFLKEKLNIPDVAMDLIFGRPMIERINEFGFKIERKGEEYVLLHINDEEGR